MAYSLLRKIYSNYAVGGDEVIPVTETTEEDDVEEDTVEEDSGTVTPAIASEVDVESYMDTGDFKWKSGKAQRDKNIPLSSTRLKAWNKFCKAKPKSKKKRTKKKKDPTREIYESKKRERKSAVAAVTTSPAFNPYRGIALADGSTFFVDSMKPATGTKSSSKAGKSFTKPLAIVYGRHGGATALDSSVAEVHVHFNTGRAIDSHTGAHVKIGEDYPYTWGAGTASAQAELNSILNEGFRSDRWKRGASYV